MGGFFSKFFGRKKESIVEFIHDGTEAVFGREKVPPESLPASFKPHTTVEFAGVSWDVVRADPLLTADAIQKGRLKIWLRKREKFDASKLLYSLPTITD